MNHNVFLVAFLDTLPTTKRDYLQFVVKTSMVDRCAETVQTISTQGSIVDRCLTADKFESDHLDVDELNRDTRFNVHGE